MKGSDTILNLKEVFLKDINVNFSLEKIEVLNSGKILYDKQFIEEFIDGFGQLNFEIKILEKDYIKINIINENNSETIVVDQFSLTDDIFNKLNKNYDFDLIFDGRCITRGNFIFYYKIEDGDNIKLIKDTRDKIELKVKLSSTRDVRKVKVCPSEPLYKLADLLNISDKSSKLYFNGLTYSLFSVQTIEEIGIKNNTAIIIFNTAIG